LAGLLISSTVYVRILRYTGYSTYIRGRRRCRLRVVPIPSCSAGVPGEHTSPWYLQDSNPGLLQCCWHSQPTLDIVVRSTPPPQGQIPGITGAGSAWCARAMRGAGCAQAVRLRLPWLPPHLPPPLPGRYQAVLLSTMTTRLGRCECAGQRGACGLDAAV
jgi:hypothetical protein